LHNQDSDQYIQQRTELTANIDKLKKQNKDLSDEEVMLKKKLDYLQKQAADLQPQAAATSGKTNAAPVWGQ
jgi:FtsZ-binding cell division protein ZapB